MSYLKSRSTRIILCIRGKEEIRINKKIDFIIVDFAS